jgi:hypothetical protein
MNRRTTAAWASLLALLLALPLLMGARPPNYCATHPSHPWCALPTLTPRPTPTPTPATTGVSLADYGGNWAQAIAAAETRGKVVTVPAGTWPAYRILTTYPGLTIDGAGPGLTIVPRNASQPCCDVGGFMHVTHANVTIQDMTLRGWPVASGPSDDILLNGRNATGLVARNLRLEDAQGIGVQIEGATMTGALLEDLTITNVVYRSNGYHGVGLWLYNGASGNTVRRVTVDGAHYAGVFLDAGTESGPAQATDDNVFSDVVVRNAGRQALPGGGVGAGWQLTGAARNRITGWTVTDQVRGPAVAFGFDQSGLGAPDNVFTNGALARIASGDAISFGGTTGNLIDTGTGAGRVYRAAGNTIRNWPDLQVVS